MARLVDPLATERQPVRTTGGVVQLREGSTVKAAGFGINAFGRDLVEGGEDLYRRQKIDEERINTLAAEDAFTKLRMRQLDLSAGDDGFTKQMGANAVTKPIIPEWTKRFNDAETQIAGTLTNDRQREKFKIRSDVARQQYTEELLRHVGKESDVYAKEVYDGTMAVENRNAVARWNSPADIGTSLLRIEHAVNDRAERYGWDAQYRDGVLKQEQGKVHAAIVGQAIATGDYKYAQQWYQAHKEDIDLPTAKHIEMAVRDGTQKEKVNTYQASFLANRDNPKGLDALLTNVSKDNELDDNRQNVLVGRIEYRQEVLARRAEAVRAHQDKIVGKAIDGLNQMTMAGYEPTVEQMAPVISAAKGTEHEQEADRMVHLANATKSFRLSPPAARSAMLQDLEAQARKDPTKFDIRTISAFRAIDENLKRDTNADPVGTAIRQGFYEGKPLDLSNPNGMGPQLREQAAVAQQMTEQYQAPFKPLTQAQASLVGSVLKGAGPADKSKYFGQLSQAAGDDPAGRTTYSAIMGQIAPDDPVTAIAGDYAGKKRSEASELMLKGQSILNPVRKEDGKPDAGKLWPMPPEKMFDQSFRELEGDAFAASPQFRNAMHQATKAIYAALSSDAGDANPDLVDSDRFKKAFDLATGGVHTHNGRSLLMPYRYDYGDFKDALDSRVRMLVHKGSSATTFDDTFETHLEPQEEQAFLKWKERNAPHDSGADYDLRGAFLAGVVPAKNGHFPDTFKKPNHPTFSDQSKYARFGTPGHWEGETFVPAPKGSKPMETAPSAAGRLDKHVTEDVLKSLPLEAVRDGVYAFRSGNSILLDKANKPILVDFNVQPGTEPVAPEEEMQQMTVPDTHNRANENIP